MQENPQLTACEIVKSNAMLHSIFFLPKMQTLLDIFYQSNLSLG